MVTFEQGTSMTPLGSYPTPGPTDPDESPAKDSPIKAKFAFKEGVFFS